MTATQPRFTYQEVERQLAEQRAALQTDGGPIARAWLIMLPRAEDAIRWRIKLDCGCTEEILTWRDTQKPPTARVHLEHMHDEAPYRLIEKSAALDPIAKAVAKAVAKAPGSSPVGRQVDFKRDPVSPPDYWGTDPQAIEAWRKIRKRHPTSKMFWRVTLDCGHRTEVISDMGWEPGDPPKQVTVERAAEMVAEVEEIAAAGEYAAGESSLEHMRRWIAGRCPQPDVEQRCYDCRHERKVVSSRRLGPLAPGSRRSVPDPAQVKASKEHRLAKLEAEAAALRRELGES